MAQIKIKEKFIIEFEEEKIVGYYRGFRKSEIKENEEIFKDAITLGKEVTELAQRTELLTAKMTIKEKKSEWDEVEKILSILEKHNIIYREKQEQFNEMNLTNKMRVREFDLCISCNTDADKARLKELAEEYGYQLMFDTILEGIAEGKPKE